VRFDRDRRRSKGCQARLWSSGEKSSLPAVFFVPDRRRIRLKKIISEISSLADSSDLFSFDD
jgi:hypothetical protein